MHVSSIGLTLLKDLYSKINPEMTIAKSGPIRELWDFRVPDWRQGDLLQIFPLVTCARNAILQNHSWKIVCFHSSLFSQKEPHAVNINFLFNTKVKTNAFNGSNCMRLL